jgi:hypothetical protein
MTYENFTRTFGKIYRDLAAGLAKVDTNKAEVREAIKVERYENRKAMFPHKFISAGKDRNAMNRTHVVAPK